MKNESTEEKLKRVTTERDALQSIVKTAQDSAKENDRIIHLLIAAGVVDEDKIAQAREIARWD